MHGVVHALRQIHNFRRMSSTPPSRIQAGSGLLWAVLVAVAYLLLWRVVMNCSGKWPAPYWFAVGLGVLLAYGLLLPRLKHLVWVILFACFAVCVTWFFGDGIYQDWARAWVFRGHRFHYFSYWVENLPTLVLMIAFVSFLLFLRVSDKSWRLAASICIFISVFFAMFIVANMMCSIRLPVDGTLPVGFDHDVFGFRLGGYYLIT